MAQVRRIVQLARSSYHLNALCNDGTVLKENGTCDGWEILDYEVPQPEVTVKGKRVIQKVPNSFNPCFETLWCNSGRNGSKSKAKDIYTKMSIGESNSDLTDFTLMLCDHIQSQEGVVGFDALHLTTYLNQKRWEQ